MTLKKSKTIRIILFAIACSAFAAGLSLSIPAEQKRMHDPSKIDAKITSCESRYDDAYYYVYTDYRIKNNSSAALDYVEVVCSFKDKNGISIGTITAKFGSVSGNGLNIEKGQSELQRTYLSERQSASYHNDFFVELYNNGLGNVTVSYKITYAKWADGYTYYGK